MTAEKRSSKMHMICVVCGKGFSSVYNEELAMYPLYHPKKDNNLGESCESKFYDGLLSIYECLHGQETSIQIPKLMSSVKWGDIQLRKEMLLWCLNQGFLGVDTMKRIVVPPIIDDITKELFSTENLAESNFAQKATDYLKSAFKVFKDDLESSSIEEEQENREEDEVDRQLDDQLEERRKMTRMFTAENSGAETRNQSRTRSRSSGMHSR